MLRNIFFDLDNTIIKDEEEDAIYYKEALRKLSYDEDDYLEICNAIDEYDKFLTEENNYYNRKEMMDFINNILNKNYSYKLVDELINVVGKYWTKRVILKEDIVKYLSNKYNLYIYTNYYQEAQSKRIENIGYSKYFQKIFCADYYGSKPFKSSFEKILNELKAKPEECLMIGDDKTRDVLAANNIGMKSILYDYNGKRDKKEIDVNNYIVIKDFEELKEIL